MNTNLHRLQRGLSLVELMVGIAVGMFVVAAAATLVTTQLTQNRRLLLEVQVQQDLRATVDIMSRELRRAGSIPRVINAAAYVWTAGVNWLPNPDLLVTVVANPPSVEFRSNRTVGSAGPYGYRLRNGTGMIESQVQAGVWQALTDRATMEVTAFRVTPLLEPAIIVACSKLCADGTQACWPRVTVRAYQIDITGRSETDGAVVRSIRSVVRLQNDQLVTDDTLGTRSCPG